MGNIYDTLNDQITNKIEPHGQYENKNKYKKSNLNVKNQDKNNLKL